MEARRAGAPQRTVVPPPPLGLLGDQALARLGARGHDAAFEAIFKRYNQPLYRYCHSIVGNSEDAADALQNTMHRVLRALPDETRDIALKPWLYRIAHNESLRLAKGRRPADPISEAGELPDVAGAERRVSREEIRSLMSDLSDLSERQRGALVMRELAGLRYDEIAATFDVSPAAAKQSVYEARRALLELARGRSMSCEVIQRSLSDKDGRRLRGRKVRAHIRDCSECGTFEVALRERPVALGALAPAMPATVAASLLGGVIGGGAKVGGGGAAAAGLGGAATQVAGLTLGLKTAAVAAAVVVAGGAAAATQLPVFDKSAGGGEAVRAEPAPAAVASGASRSSGGVVGASESALVIAEPPRRKGREKEPARSQANAPGADRPAGSGNGRGAQGGRGNSKGKPNGQASPKLDRAPKAKQQPAKSRSPDVNPPNQPPPRSNANGSPRATPGTPPQASPKKNGQDK